MDVVRDSVSERVCRRGGGKPSCESFWKSLIPVQTPTKRDARSVGLGDFLKPGLSLAVSCTIDCATSKACAPPKLDARRASEECEKHERCGEQRNQECQKSGDLGSD